MTEEVTLAPCPFCGDEPALDAAEVDEPSFSPEDQLAISWIVGCSCSAFLGPFLDDAEAIAAWNARANQPPAQDGLEAEIERLEGLVQTYRGAQLRAEEKLCRERANAQGWKVRAEMLASKLDALASLGDKP